MKDDHSLNQARLAYGAPELIVHGSLEQVTAAEEVSSSKLPVIGHNNSNNPNHQSSPPWRRDQPKRETV